MLSTYQWISLIVITVGCIIKEMGHERAQITAEAFNIFNLSLIMVQVFCSCFAGVYNEYILKNAGVNLPIMLQNMFMYIDSIFCNIIALFLTGKLGEAFTTPSLQAVFNINVILIMCNNAGIGIVTSLFLRNLNSILKTIASALELMFTAVLCLFIFNIPIDSYTFAGIAIVTSGIWIYTKNPVHNPAPVPVDANNQNIKKQSTNIV